MPVQTHTVGSDDVVTIDNEVMQHRIYIYGHYERAVSMTELIVCLNNLPILYTMVIN